MAHSDAPFYVGQSVPAWMFDDAKHYYAVVPEVDLVNIPNGKAFVEKYSRSSADILAVRPQIGTVKVVSKDSANLRAGGSADSKIVSKAKPGEQFP